MPEVETPTAQPQQALSSAPTFRLDVQLHDLLMKPPDARTLLPAPKDGKEQTLPEPVFPQYPELMAAPDEDFFPSTASASVNSKHIYRAMRGWAFPFIRSRVMPGDFHPIIAYLFNEWKCNLDCHYCWAFDNSVRGMTEDVAKRSIDWLRDSGAGVLALMGGEPLLRPDFAHKIIYYAAKKGFWIYLPTNGRLLWPKVIDKVADAGVATINLAVDAWDDVPGRGLPKAMVPIRSHFDYLVKKQYKYGYSVLPEHQHLPQQSGRCAAVDRTGARQRHRDRLPHLRVADDRAAAFKHLREQSDVHPRRRPSRGRGTDRLADREAELRLSHGEFGEAPGADEGVHRGQSARLGLPRRHNSLIVRVDGTLAPCFPMYNASYDWGTIENHKFERKQLKDMKQECQKTCFSTLNHILAFCYNDERVIKWLWKQAKVGFKRIEGNFED